MSPDFRQIRSREALQQALLSLILEVKYDSISIADIALRARVARKTFYAHYSDKDSLLIDCVKPKMMVLMEGVSNTNINSLLADEKPASYPAFKFVQENAQFFRNVLGENGSAGFYSFILEFLTLSSFQMHKNLWQAAKKTSIEPLLIAHFLAGALLNSIIWWLKHDCQPSAEIMAYSFSNLAAPGAIEVLGLD